MPTSRQRSSTRLQSKMGLPSLSLTSLCALHQNISSMHVRDRREQTGTSTPRALSCFLPRAGAWSCVFCVVASPLRAPIACFRKPQVGRTDVAGIEARERPQKCVHVRLLFSGRALRVVCSHSVQKRPRASAQGVDVLRAPVALPPIQRLDLPGNVFRRGKDVCGRVAVWLCTSRGGGSLLLLLFLCKFIFDENMRTAARSLT